MMLNLTLFKTHDTMFGRILITAKHCWNFIFSRFFFFIFIMIYMSWLDMQVIYYFNSYYLNLVLWNNNNWENIRDSFHWKIKILQEFGKGDLVLFSLTCLVCPESFLNRSMFLCTVGIPPLLARETNFFRNMCLLWLYGQSGKKKIEEFCKTMIDTISITVAF